MRITTGSETGEVQRSRPKGPTVLRIFEGTRYVGDIVLDRKHRVWRKAVTVPSDVVLKALLAFDRRGESAGEVVGLQGQRKYQWHVVGAAEEQCERLEAA